MNANFQGHFLVLTCLVSVVTDAKDELNPPHQSPPTSVVFADETVVKQVALLETNLTRLADDMALVSPNPLSGGLILIWSGSAKTLPAGWALCNGANGTPDLRNRFIRGAAGSGDVGERGGAATHTHAASGHRHPVPTLGHAHSIASVDDIRTENAGDHTHDVGIAIGGSIHVDQLGFGGEFVAAKGHDHTLFSSRPRWHRHLLNIPGHSTTGTESGASISHNDSTVQNADHLPPYYALCFIMKLPEKEPAGWSPPTGLNLSGRVSALSQTTSSLKILLKSATSNAVPDGLIAFWSGLTDLLPQSWTACDGDHNSPDLRNRFVLGANGSREAGEQGGGVSHTHATHAHQHRVTLPDHSHTIPAVITATHISGAHMHTLGPANGIKNTEVGNDRYDLASRVGHTHILSLAGAHSHSLELPAGTTEPKEATGWTGLSNFILRFSLHLPPFERLRHLMKLKPTASPPALHLAPPTSPVLTRVTALEKALNELSTAIHRISLDSVPVGTIAVWSGTVESLPPAWVPCDGRSGTPNLSGRFVMGAENEAGSTGGNTTHNHSLGFHRHTAYCPHSHDHRSRILRTLTIVDSEHSILDYETRHTHSFSMLCQAVSDLTIGGSIQVATELHAHELLDGGEAHEHEVTVDQPLTPATEALTSTTSEETYASYEAQHLPPYLKLLFIMKTDGASLPPPTITAPSTVAAGQALALAWTIPNLITTLSNSTRIGRAYLSKDTDYDVNEDRLLGQVLFDPKSLIAGKYAARQSFTLPEVPPGDYYVIVQIDRDKFLSGTTDPNVFHTATITIRAPDLSPTKLDAPSVADAGQTLVTTWIVINQGTGETVPSWSDQLYLSADTVFSPTSDRFLGEVTHSQALAPQNTYKTSLKFTMPTLPSGLYYLILRVDHDDKLQESNIKNNNLIVPVQLIDVKPAQLVLSTARAPSPRLPEISMASAVPTTHRVEFNLNGQLLGTAYGSPFNLNTISLPLSAKSALLSAKGDVSATGFDSIGSLVCQATLGLGESHEGFPTRLNIDQPYENYTLYTDDSTAPNHSLLIRVYAAREYLSVIESETGHTAGMRHDIPLTNGQFQIQFAIDGAVVHTSTNGLPGDPFYHECNYNAEGLRIGTHHLTVRLIHPEGFWDASDSRSFVVEQRHPDLRVQRDVYSESNHFRVTLTLHNDGSGSAILRSLRETMTGFQPCRILTSMPLDSTTTTFSLADKQCALEFDFGDVTLLADSYRTLSYRAVPILFQTDCEYTFGGDGEVEYENRDGIVTSETINLTTTFTSPYASRLAILTAINNAFRSSDYLLVTSPVNLERSFSAPEAVTILSDMADLATRRNGVLGFFHGAGQIRSPFRTGDLIALGNFFSSDGAMDELFVGSIGNHRVSVYSENKELTLSGAVPMNLDLRAGDCLVVGNVRSNYETGTNDHRLPEIVVAFGDAHDRFDQGDLLIHQYAYSTNAPFTIHELSSSFSTGARLAIGEVWAEAGNDRDEIIAALTDGRLIGFSQSGPWSMAEHSVFRGGDHFAAGNLMPNGQDELVIGNLGGGLVVYNFDRLDATGRYPQYQRACEVPLVETLEAEDGFAVGDVLGDHYAEIIVAYASRDQIRIYSYDSASDSFERAGMFDVTFDASDRLAVGYFGSSAKAQIIIAHGAEATHRQAGTIEFYPYVDGLTPGSARALDRLMDREGAWANRLATNWADQGYLLIVGENEIIPTFSKTWDLYNNDAGRVDYTDRNYASTDSSSENCLPELSVGRVVGNSAERLHQALLTAISLASDPRDLDNSDAYCVSGSDPDDDEEFVPMRDSIAEKLRDRGFDAQEQHTPNAATFHANAINKDVIFLAGHGSPTSWCDPTVTGSNIASDFNPGNTIPLVYASSCLTGRYPDGTKTLSEQFLNNGAAVFIGSTENSLVAGDFGWGRRIGQAFFDRIEAGRPLGHSLKLAKRHRLSDAANSYSWDWNYNRFTCASYQYYGDPKAEIHWPARSLAHANNPPNRNDEIIPVIAGPLSEFPLKIPSFEVFSRKGAHIVEIPDGETLIIPGKPMVPFYTATVRFPKGQIVQEVALNKRSGLHATTGLLLPPAIPRIEADATATAAAIAPSGWWPDRDFDWSISENPDGSRDLTIKAFAFFYNSETTESRFFSNYVFGISWAASTVDILRFASERQAYPSGALVKAGLVLQNIASQPIDVVAEAIILRNEADLIEKLPPVQMPNLKTLGWATLQWDAKQAGGDYAMEVRIRDLAGHELDRARAEFQIGLAAGAISRFDFTPRDYPVGDDVKLSATFVNSGNTTLDGTVVIAIQDASANPVIEFRQSFSALTAGAAFRFDTVWEKAGIRPQDCQFLVYGLFEGQTTALSLFARQPQPSLMWNSIAVSAKEVELTWPSVTGGSYSVEFSPELVTVPFTCIASNLPATPPQNRFFDSAQRPQGFYRLKENP
ncbi:MAG TPA: C25 family cysteine peptidase [Candidatus Paceibacterota bacterium]|nr:C25 family cysteine peptidase [Candidatus Paceibacterota bacterium]